MYTFWRMVFKKPKERKPMSTYWGYHLMLDCGGCERITDPNNLKAFVKENTEFEEVGPISASRLELP